MALYGAIQESNEIVEMNLAAHHPDGVIPWGDDPGKGPVHFLS
jgi:hypothetical protein